MPVARAIHGRAGQGDRRARLDHGAGPAVVLPSIVADVVPVIYVHAFLPALVHVLHAEFVPASRQALAESVQHARSVRERHLAVLLVQGVRQIPSMPRFVSDLQRMVPLADAFPVDEIVGRGLRVVAFRVASSTLEA